MGGGGPPNLDGFGSDDDDDGGENNTKHFNSIYLTLNTLKTVISAVGSPTAQEQVASMP